MKALRSRRKAFLLLSGLLLGGSMASAQILIEGNVYGGGNLGEVTQNTSVTINGGTIGKKIPLYDRTIDQNLQLRKRVDFGNVYGGGNGYDQTVTIETGHVPNFDIRAGLVKGNTSVTIQGNAVVRRAVYGGGNMASVGDYTENGVYQPANGTGKTTVTITGDAHIGPKKEDLTSATTDELNQASADFGAAISTVAQYTDTAFKYLGSNEGWVFGSSRGLAGDELKEFSFVDTTEVIINSNAQAMNVFGSGENGHVKRGTNVLIAGNAIIGGVPLHGDKTTEDYTTYYITSGTYNDVTVKLKAADGELVEDDFGVGRLVTRGNVLGGGKGSDFISWLANPQYGYTAGRTYGSATVSVKDNAQIYNRVFGGGLIASVGTFTEDANHAITGVENNTGNIYVNIEGGTIGSPDSDGLNNGEVYGGGRGLPGRRVGNGGTIDPLHQALDLAYVGNTHVTVSGGTVMNSVYGGAANGHVQENSNVLVEGGTIGTDGVGDWHGNVFAGGGGTTRYKDNGTLNFSITAGRVFGDTELEMTDGHVLHNVYGGGAIASVGTYNASELVNPTNPYLGHGHSKITITGGEVGTDGDNNGMVFGSGRGQIAEPGNFLDYVTYVAFSEVNIGTGTVNPETGEASNISGNAKINGSVYGSGENGHTYLEAVVNVFSDTIGCTPSEYADMSPEDKVNKFPYRGNVYGAGCGTEQYRDGDVWKYNPLAGVVQGNAKVNIYGGYISRSVYGAGAMASVGSFTVTGKHTITNSSAALSWPYELEYDSITDSNGNKVATGTTEVNIRGGHIGTLAAPMADCGNVFGSARGDVGPLGHLDSLAIVKETFVNINFTPSENNVILGSVYGSGENGTVYQDTQVTMTNGLVRGSVFGGGDGTDMYRDTLWVVDESQSLGYSVIQDTLVYSITSGKVYGNTEVVINGGTVRHNVFGGGNLASVGKGNYMGYGELTNEATDTPYENSGVATVTINGGTIGTTGYLSDGYNNGYVFGSSKGIPFKTIDATPRYNYSRDFFLGYTNKTIVNIGSDDANVTTGPTIKGAVFGGGDNGHVRWHTNVTVNKGEIGEAYVMSTTPDPDSLQKWAYRGNVYGAGRGTDMYDSDGHGNPDSYCPSAGSVTLNTNVTVNGGTIHRNVYGGGSMATVGPPPTGYNPGTSKCTVNVFGGTIGEVVNEDEDDEFLYGGNVYGAGRGIIDVKAPLAQFASASNAEVNVEIGNETDKVIGNVYGGGSYGQVKQETNVNMIKGTVEGSIYGGGMGSDLEEVAGLVAGNATVDMTGGTVERSIYGGGELGSVGTFTYSTVTYPSNDPNGNAGKTVQYPISCAENTGLTTVTMSGGTVGVRGSLMPWTDHNPDDDDRGWIFCGGRGEADSITYPKAIALGVVGATHLEISNTVSDETTIRPLVTASVYGGCENGLVLDSTYVVIAGGQIGTGHYKVGDVHHFDPIYDEADDWAVAIAAVQSGVEADINAAAARFHECDAWTYAAPYYVYDIFADSSNHPNNQPGNPDHHTAALQGTNGHSFFGNVFGGGSGYYPIRPGIWRRTAGQVNGNTRIEITDGHILTSVYGGNETTDVKGKCTIKMSGGTLGVPRTIQQIKDHPVTCYLFGAGMGDTRTQFNTWTHVDDVEVSITGGTIFGSVFGGGEDGHVLGDVTVNVGQDADKTTLIGTWGRSYVDGNVFGGGRGFSGNALTAGVVMGNVDMNISGGTMLGSIYGGGRLASVGTRLVAPTDPEYGQLLDDDGDGTHGHVTINITGGIIGNDYEAIYHTDFNEHTTGGNVFAGAMGRVKNLDNITTNTLWPNLGKVKETIVTIDGDNTLIKGNVYGGGEFGTVETNATITVSGGTIMRDVYGGGYGSNDITATGYYFVPKIENGQTVRDTIEMTPMKLAGRVNGNTNITVEGGWIQKSVYGGGEMATVGIIKNDSVPHTNVNQEFALSWPYQMNYEANTGTTEINVTGGRLGITGSDYMGPWDASGNAIGYNPDGTSYTLTPEQKDEAKQDNGDIYGGGKGFAADRYLEAHANNVHDTHITINYTNNTATPTNYKDKENGVYSHDCITGAVYGGGENGHVIQNTNITLTDGLVGHNIYGGGKGKGTYMATLHRYTVNSDGSVTEGAEYDTTVYSITAGKVYGNTYVNMTDGYVVRNIYGGGNMASVGKGNYTGAPDDYSTTGYGECVITNGPGTMADTLNSGNTFVTITGGQLGYLNPSDPDKVIKDGLPYGSVYGGCRGEVSRDVPRTLSPRILYSPEDFLGYVNKTHVVIGNATGSSAGPRLYGSVYGGGQDGHVRWNSNVTVNKGEIGVDYGGTELISNDPTIQNDSTSSHWTNRGNVYGAGSGIGQYTDANNVKQYSYISGSVTQFSTVNIKGGTIHNNVYGGGNLATVGPPRILQPTDCTADKTGVTVNITGNAEIGKNTNMNAQYGGKVFGASRGIASEELGTDGKPKYKDFAYCSYTEVNVYDEVVNDEVVASPIVYGVVFGGGENGKVGLYHETDGSENGNNIHTSTVNINGGIIKHGVFGGGQGVWGDVIPETSPEAYYVNDTMSGRVMGDATVNLMGGIIGVDDGNYAGYVYGGCRRSFVWGNTLVNVGSGTWNPATETYEVFDGKLTIYGSIFGANRYKGTPYGNSTVNVFQTAHTEANAYPTIPDNLVTLYDTLNWLDHLDHGLDKFAIKAVYGGSDLIDYTPKAGKQATVNVFQCEENTIYDVYGGGNAAAIGSASADYQTNANVNIYGGRIYRVFGGGNGEETPADVHGLASTIVNGGLINQVFGGSNNNGIIDDINLVINQNTGCLEYIVDVFGGGNSALIIGDVTSTVECCNAFYNNYYGGSSYATIYGNVSTNIFGATFINLFGGSKGSSTVPSDIRKFPEADYDWTTNPDHHPEEVKAYLIAHSPDPEANNPNSSLLCGTGGNVTLNIFGGNITNAFGGSHVNGVIDGKIQVNVFNVGGACDLDLTTLYGAGLETPYTPNYAINTAANEKRLTPEINLINGTVKGCVYGGGQGATATTTANPVVNIGYGPEMGSPETGLVAMLTQIVTANDSEAPSEYTARVERDVYGGGDLAGIIGSPTVNVRKANTVIWDDLYGGGSGTDGNLDAAKVQGSDTVRIYDGWIRKNVFGGGKMAIVTGDTKVEMSGGTIGVSDPVMGSLYGGGRGSSNAVNNQGNTIAESPDYGRVMGNTYVDIWGDAIVHKNVYGGGQMGSVGNGSLSDNTTGVARVTVSGGQIGPFNSSSDEPNANVYGGGQGEVNAEHVSHYITHANVDSTSVIICDSAFISGNVFGGSANGHVLAGTRVLVEKGTNTKDKKPTIGTDGLHNDGLVFGGGQGTSGSFTAGRVGGNTKVEMTDGTVKGNIYGGGSVALTGVDVNGSFDSYESLNSAYVHEYDSIHHGLTWVEVSGGTIGNDDNGGLDLLLSDLRAGNIYGGGRGDLNEFREDDYGRAANAIVHITNSPYIYGSVYGGGQMANVGRWNDYDTWYTQRTGTTRVTIEGTPIIGTVKEFDHAYSIGTGDDAPKWTLYDTINGVRMITHTLTGNVFGSGQGNVKLNSDGFVVGLEHGHCRTTDVNISGNSTIMGSVFGGSEQGAVWGDTKVNIAGDAVIGTQGIMSDSVKYGNNHTYTHATYSYGNVFGGSYGMDAYTHLNLTNPTEDVLDSINGLSGRVYGNTFVNITGGAVRCNVFGGGDKASVGEWDPNFVPKPNTGIATVYVADSAIVGPLDYTGLNAYVFGGGKGIGKDPNNLRKKYCNLNSADVTVELGENGHVWGSLFGGGSDAHTLGDARVTLLSGTIGTDGTTSWDGNIFGGGRNFQRYNYTAGRVGGNTEIEMKDGVLLGNIFGGGRMGQTGIDVDGNMQDGTDHGYTKVMVKGGTVGNVDEIETFTAYSMGNVFGGGMGNINGVIGHPEASALLLGLTKNTVVEISDTIGNNTHVYGIVFGGGEVANVGKYTWSQDGTTISNIQLTEGLAKINISGGIIGGDRAKMRYEKDPEYEIYPLYNDDLGYVYGGGAGISDNPNFYPKIYEGATTGPQTSLLDLIATVNNTEVTITNDTTVDNSVSKPWIKASVFGGAESGHVRGNTKVTISGGQIGAGDNTVDNVDMLYDDDDFKNPTDPDYDVNYSLYGTIHWPFGSGGDNPVYNPYDPSLVLHNIVPSDGKSWFGNVFGGGSGWFPYFDTIQLAPQHDTIVSRWNSLAGKVWGNTEVIITGGHILNNVYGANEATDVGGKATVRMSGGTVGVPRTQAQIMAQPVMGYLFGGGCGDPRAIADELNNVDSTNVTITGGIIYGSALGGAEDGHVLGNTKLTVMEDDPENNPTVIGTLGCTGVDGNLFGGGRNFLLLTYAAGRVGGNATVNMKGGKVLGSIYGGGRNALTGFTGSMIPVPNQVNIYQALREDEGNGDDDTYGHTKVMVSGGTVGNLNYMRHSDYSIGNVYGGGKGSKTGVVNRPPSSALLVSLTKDTKVEVSGSARIYGSVFGGSEVANVGNYTWTQTQSGISNINVIEGTGNAKVTVSGGTIGMDNMQMITESGYPDDFGYVFGGGEGWVESPDSPTNPVIYTEGGIDYHLVERMATVVTTDVEISNDAFVLGSVYGGGFNGHVSDSTWVKIKGGQIGAGNGVFYEGTQINRPYTDEEWDYAQHQSLPECASWTYGGDYAPYDIFIKEGGKPKPGKNGATFYGNVFGGGSGYYPYGVDSEGNSQWLRSSGQVRGNTRVEVTAGHILTSLYGGCEVSDVGMYKYDEDIHGEVWDSKGGKATVIMSGGTLGVPRTLEQIQAHPVTCYVFGGGKGDPRFYFNTWTNVWDSKVEIKGTAWVYGSVFGGGEEGHVLNHVDLDVSGTPKIGTLGYSYVDGNIFGGGRGFSGQALTAGSVGGNIDIDITGGTMLGSVYGGGRLASVGTYLVDKEIPDPENPDQMMVNPYYGKFQPYAEQPTEEEDLKHGHITINISGGTIGNEQEYVYADPDATPAEMAEWQSNHNIPYTEFDANNKNHLSRTKGGNVFGGAMGRLTQIDGTTINPIWPSLARVKQTKVIVSGDAVVKSSVYGGGEFGTVRNNDTVRIQGGTIGTRIENPNYDPEHPGNAEQQYHFGSVYGGGFGSKELRYTGEYANDSTGSGLYQRPVEIAGRVYGNTFVSIRGGQVLENVFGGGELASIGMVKDGAMVNGLATVEMTGGQVGRLDMTGLNAYVYGGSKGVPNHDYADYCNVNTSSVTVNMAQYDEEHDTGHRVWGSLFGGGSDGHVLGNASVTLVQGTLGTTGTTTWDGNIFGGGRNYSAVSETAGRVGGNVYVTVKGGHMLGSIFGGGRLGSVGIGADGAMIDGTDHGYITVNVGGSEQVHDITIGHTAYSDHDRVGGNVYGGGKGIAGSPTSIYPKLAKVKQTEVNIAEKASMKTFVEGSVFGSGEDGHVLQDTYVNILGGQIGGETYAESGEPVLCEDYYHGNVYGGGRGLDTYEVEVTDPDTQQTSIEQRYSETAGVVYGNSNVTISGGRICRNVYGGGNLSSVGQYQTDPETGEVITDPVTEENLLQVGTGLAKVTISGGKIGVNNDNSIEHGNVFGSSHGLAGAMYKNLAYVHNTEVRLEGDAIAYGAVFGGGEDGHVNQHTKVSINGSAEVGFSGNDENNGNVYGGGRGIDLDASGNLSPTAGLVKGHSRVYINNGKVWGDVFGGGHTSVVQEERVVNINDGTIERNVYGGGNTAADPSTYYASMKTVNVRNGNIKGDVFGCSKSANEGDKDDPESTAWTSFVNITGGTIDGSVYGSGYERRVNGSVCVNVGCYPILNAPNKTANLYAEDSEDGTAIEPSAVNHLVIKGDMYGGSHHVATGQIEDLWNTYDVSGYSYIYIDGTGYDTKNAEPTVGQPKLMNLEGGLYGCGTHCESGAQGRDIILRNYGQRNVTTEQNPGELVSATRTFKTAQRCSNFLLDNANINFSGYRDISGKSDSLYAVVKINENLYVSNASSMALGSIASPAYMDSIVAVHSTYLTEGEVYANDNVTSLPWGWIGLHPQAAGFANVLVYMNGTTSGATLVKAKENVILFNGRSRMWVRYHKWEPETSGSSNYVDRQYYGELEGFFRMRGDYFQPYGNESFAYARPKLTVLNSEVSSQAEANKGDGGFLSYHTDFNFHTQVSDDYEVEGNDGGLDYTNTKQYPYSNVMEISSKGDMQEFRLWAIPRITGRPWYVDGRDYTGSSTTGGIGVNDMEQGRGLYPDMPKLTVSADLSTTATDIKKGIYAGAYDISTTIPNPHIPFDQKKDVIYVVGAVSSAKELAVNASGILNQDATKPLRLYRYPGGHALSQSGATDPGANYKALVEVEESLTLNNVVVDGLFGYDGYDGFNHYIPISYNYKGANVPMVITHPNSVLSMSDSTTLMNGYNNLPANSSWYFNPDYSASAGVYHGGALFVDENATVNVSDLVTIKGNKQCYMVGSVDHPIECNVYLPTFDKSLTITGELTASTEATTQIGITSPKRKNNGGYKNNTFSPVAVAHKVGSTSENQDNDDIEIAVNAWTNNNFLDDQGWFFTSGGKNTYYSREVGNVLGKKTLYFGWTWANVVRKEPEVGDFNGEVTDAFDYENINSPYALAWLISQSAGMNGESATDFKNVTIAQTKDFDMNRYVWVPIGTESKPFRGTYDGQGHLIDGLAIEYLSETDVRYERNNYGLFGNVEDGTINRTFVVGGLIVPDSIPYGAIGNKEETLPVYNIGGLAGYLEGSSVVSNSEAALAISTRDKYKAYAGGLVGELKSGEIHSSMAMPKMTIDTASLAGGLVGRTSGGKVSNSFVNAKIVFKETDNRKGKGGGLLGANGGSKVRNCYVAVDVTLPTVGEGQEQNVTDFFDGLVKTQSSGSIDSCYVENGFTFANSGSFNKNFTPVFNTDTYGYMYSDNKVLIGPNVDTAMFRLLNHWVDKADKTHEKFARWARPTLHSINGDLPVLMLCNYNGESKEGQGEFRSLATYKQGPALQYGGPVRDDDQLNTALRRPKADDSKKERLFIYGDFDGDRDHDGTIDEIITATITADSIAIYEHAAILAPGTLADFDKTFVGVTFDNTSRSATDFYGDQLNRDWHMFSTPLSNAPLGIDYEGQNTNDENDENYVQYNHWTGDSLIAFHFYPASQYDGYFPSNNPAYNPQTDKYKYPYDFFCWYEPDWQWINFKRNGPSHWHHDHEAGHVHPHIDYYAIPGSGLNKNINEVDLIPGKGYQMSIQEDTYLQSHGKLNNGEVSFPVVNSSGDGNAWGVGPLYFGNNLIGNPYHAYLDFNAFGDEKEGNNFSSYYVYDADTAAKRNVDYLIYPDGGSTGGCYASRYIHPHQGFFVQYKPEDLTPANKVNYLTFSPSMTVTRKDVENADFREEQPAYPLVNLFAYDWEDKGDVLVVEFNRPENGGGIKSKSLRSGNHLVFAHHGDYDYGAFFAKEGTTQVPVRFQSFEKDKKPYTFRWNLQNGDFRSLYLIDNMTGVQYDMLRNDSYSFEASKQDYLSRFIIVFDVTDVEEHAEGFNFAFFDGSTWVVNGKGRLEVVDVLGRVLHAETLHGDQNRVSLDNYAKGIYLLRLWEGDTPKIQKIIMH